MTSKINIMALDRYITGNYGEDQYDSRFEKAFEYWLEDADIEEMATASGVDLAEFCLDHRIDIDETQLIRDRLADLFVTVMQDYYSENIYEGR